MVKLTIAFAAVALAFTAIIIKLFYIQVLSPGTHQSQYLSTRSIRPERGRILDRNGEPLVVNQPAYLLYAKPKHIESRHTLIRDLDEILKMGPATLEGYLDDTKQWVAVKKNIDQDTKDKIESLQLAGLGFEEGQMRYYPEASLAAHIAGFVGRNAEDEEIGYFGIEGFYDKELSGLSGILRSETDLLGRPIFVGVQERVNPENGRDLYLTIDKSVQLIIKKRLISAMERYEAAEGCVVVADPDSMQILGLTCLPDFDPTEYYNSSEDVFKNPAISNVYEPGSIFKPLIVAAGIEEKAIKPDERYDEDGPVQVGGYTIRTWNDEYGGRMSMSQILERSSNVGMVYIGSKLGDDAVYDYITKLGFGQETGIDLQGEVRGSLKPRKSWYPIDYATATFGQGIAVTPVQILRAFSAVINGGYLYRPYVVLKTEGSMGENERKKTVDARIYSARTSEILRKMLVSTVEHGEAHWNVPKGYKIGGKTGTAQVAIAGHYDAEKTIASYIGFAPADKPKFIAIVVLREPAASPWASETAAPLFFEIAGELLTYYGVSPSK